MQHLTPVNVTGVLHHLEQLSLDFNQLETLPTSGLHHTHGRKKRMRERDRHTHTHIHTHTDTHTHTHTVLLQGNWKAAPTEDADGQRQSNPHAARYHGAARQPAGIGARRQLPPGCARVPSSLSQTPHAGCLAQQHSHVRTDSLEKGSWGGGACILKRPRCNFLCEPIVTLRLCPSSLFYLPPLPTLSTPGSIGECCTNRTSSGCILRRTRSCPSRAHTSPPPAPFTPCESSPGAEPSLL